VGIEFFCRIDHLEMEEVTSRTIGGKHQLKIANHVFDDLVRQNSQTLLKARKLVLVLDLDHTLLHASHDSRAKDLLGHEEFKDTLHEVFLAQGHTGHHYIKLRPYAREFIHNLQKYYDIRIFTWGLRHYAERVVELLDPEDKIIHSKIVSRDDMGLGDVKTVQQKDFTRIFPCDDEMVIVIDDDPRVWASAQENLLTIPKCKCFFFYTTFF
jgi:RNA polymerase II subunit A-like phosphatase